MSNKAGRGSDQFMIRLPDGMRDRIKMVADFNGRSMNAEIVATLEKVYPPAEQVALINAVADLEAHLETFDYVNAGQDELQKVAHLKETLKMMKIAAGLAPIPRRK